MGVRDDELKLFRSEVPLVLVSKLIKSTLSLTGHRLLSFPWDSVCTIHLTKALRFFIDPNFPLWRWLLRLSEKSPSGIGESRLREKLSGLAGGMSGVNLPEKKWSPMLPKEKGPRLFRISFGVVPLHIGGKSSRRDLADPSSDMKSAASIGPNVWTGPTFFDNGYGEGNFKAVTSSKS